MTDNQTIQLGCAGLVSDPGPFSGTPPGSLVQAENVSFRRPGVIEPRVPFNFTFDSSGPTTTVGVASYYDGTGTATYQMGTGTFSSKKWRVNGSADVTGPITFSFTQDKTHFCQSSGRGYFTADQGVAVVDSYATRTSARLAGVPRGPGFIATMGVDGTGGDWMLGTATKGYLVGYRTLVVRTLTDTSQTQIYGEPSSLRTICNTFGADRFPTLRIYLSSDMQAGDRVQVYRTTSINYTLASATSYWYPVIDEPTLRYEYTLTSSDISTGYFDFADKLPDTQFSGPYLYTNASQEGPLLPNSRPYYARDVALYNGMTFYAGQRSPQRVSVTIKSTSLSGLVYSPTTTLCGATDTGATVILGSNVITGVTNTDRFSAGQYIAGVTGGGTTPQNPESAGIFPANTTIVSVNTGANTITVSANALANNTGIVAYDWINVYDGSTNRRLYFNCMIFNANQFRSAVPKWVSGYDDWTVGTNLTYPGGGAADIERAFAQNYGTSSFRLSAVGSETDSDDIALVVERTDCSIASFTLKSNKPAAFDRTVDSTGITSIQEGYPGLLAWSKLDQPEAVPAAYTNQIGDRSRAILRIVPTRDALYIFKEDGVFRCFGDSPELLSFQLLDPTCGLSINASNMATVLGADVYAWTQRGIVRIGAGGIQDIDQAIGRSATGPLGPTVYATRSWACSSNQGSWVAFGYSQTNSGTNQYQAWVYHPSFGTWSTWTFRRTVTAAYSDGINTVIACDESCYATPDDSDFVSVSSVAPYCGDYLPNRCAITNISGTTITISGSSWTPAVGDAIGPTLDGTFRYVTAVTDSTHFAVNTASGLTTSAFGVRENNTTKVYWIANPGGTPATMKQWVNSFLVFSRIRYGSSFLAKWQGYKNPTERTSVHTYDATYAAFPTALPYLRRFNVPTQCGRDWALKIGFEWSTAATWFACDGAAVSFNVAGDRV